MADETNPLASFEVFMGTWTGANTAPDSSGTDIMTFSWIMGGKAVQHLHSIDQGQYGGSTIYFWDTAANEGAGGVIYHYFTTAGFHTQGTGYWEGDVFHATEHVTGHESITEVRSQMHVTDDGSGLSSTSEYLSNNEWVSGHGFNYARTPDAFVVFGE